MVQQQRHYWADDLFKFSTLYFVDRSQTEVLGWLQVAY